MDWNKTRHGLEINPDLMALSDGVHPALIAALKAFARPGSKVLLTTSTYSGFYTDLRESHTLAEESPLIIDNGVHRLDFDDLESRISQDTDALILCNPQNPDRETAGRRRTSCGSARLCLERRVVVLADEIHCDFVTKGQKYTAFASLPDKDVVNNSVTFQSGSKTFSLAAMKVAWFHSPNPEYFQKVQDQHMRADQHARAWWRTMPRFRGGADWLDQLLAYLDGNHDLRRAVPPRERPANQVLQGAGHLPRLAGRVADLAEQIGAAGKSRGCQRNRGGAGDGGGPSSSAGWSKTPACTRTPGSNYGPGGEGSPSHEPRNVPANDQAGARQHRGGDEQPVDPPALRRTAMGQP